MTTTAAARPRFDEICPDFCELTEAEHENIDTEESPLYVHGTKTHVVHGFHMYISMPTDETGAEVDDDALAIFIDGRQLSLREAQQLSRALSEAVNRADWSPRHIRRRLDSPVGMDRVTFDWIMAYEQANHEKHQRLREARNDPAHSARS